jgi:hypothetical protein
MPSPLTDFEQNFRSADTLLKVYRLFESPDGPHSQHNLMERVRELLMANQEEELILLINELFLGVVRENADVKPSVFKRDNLCMLLRQAVVAACSALDVYFPALLREHLPLIIQVKQRNFIPSDKSVKDFLKGFHLNLEETLRVLNDPGPEIVLGDMLVEHLKGKTLSNSQGVEVTLLFLGVDDPWDRIAYRLGQSKDPLMRQFNSLVARRNDIVHRGDRPARDPNGPTQDIQFSWTYSHVQVSRSVVQAADELVKEQIGQLEVPA